MAKHIRAEDAGPVVQLICGLVAMIGVVVQSSPYVRVGQMAVFMALAALAGKRVRVLPPLIMLISVTIANLLVPQGKVLLEAGRFAVTLGALESGLLKGSLLVGLIYVSRLSISGSLRLPGTLGAILARSFAYFEALNRRWPETSGKLIQRLDELLLYVHKDSSEGEAKDTPGLPLKRLLLIGGALLCISWLPVVL